MKHQKYSRRQFLTSTSIALTGMAIASKPVWGMPAYIPNLGKPNSLFKGVQIGVITYSFRSLPSSAEQLLQYCLDANISAIELMGTPAEQFAGAPAAPPRIKDAAERKAMMAEYRRKLAEWRSSIQMTKFEQLRQMYNKAGVSIYGYKPSA